MVGTPKRIDQLTATTSFNDDDILVVVPDGTTEAKKIKKSDLGIGGAVDSVNGATGTVVLDTGDLLEATDKNYVTDAEKVVIGNTSNTNTGDETESTIKTKLGITTISGSNTGDQVGDGVTITGAGTIGDPFVSVGGSGSGDVTGPVTNTDNYIPQWNGANSKDLKDGLGVVTTLGTPGANTNVPTEAAVRAAISIAGGGDVTGPVSATDNNVVMFDGITGKIIKDSGLTISGSNTGDQTSIVGITGTTSQFNTANTDGDFSTLAGTETLTNKTLTSPVINTPTGIVTNDITESTDKNYVSDAELVVIGNTSNTNTGDETTTTLGSKINLATAKTTPVDADMVGLMDSAATNILKKLSWANIKATLKTYFDTLYQTILSKATGAEIDTGTDDAKYTTAKGIKDSHNVPSVAPGTSGNVLTSDGTDWTSAAPSGGGGVEPIRIRIPGEMVADTSIHQGIFRRNTTGATITISNVKIGLGLSAQGTGSVTFNIYKSSGTASDGIDTSATALFTSDISLGNDIYIDDTNVPDTTTVEDGRWISLRCKSSAGTTRKAQDVEVVIYYS